MVNTGKPSAGCEACRARHIKCDESRPVCIRCQNSKRICPGYRDLSKIRFGGKPASKKESSSFYSGKERSRSVHGAVFGDMMANRDFQADNLIAISHLVDPSTDVAPGVLASAIGYTSLSSMHLQVSEDEAAHCFFLANFILLPNTVTKMGHLNFVIPLLKTASESSPLRSAFSAVSFAAFGAQPNSRALLPKAKLNYVQALKHINVALADPKQTKGDSIMATTLLLTVYEALLHPETDLKGWHSHIDGAVALITSGRRRLFRSETSRELFLSIRELMTIEYIGMSKTPSRGVYWWINRVPEQEVSQRYALLNLYVAELRADNNKITTLSPHMACNTEIVVEFLTRAEELEKQYRDWQRNQALCWEPATVAWIDDDDETIDLSTAEAFPGRVETFTELTAGYRYNIARSSQILIWTSILRAVAWRRYPNDYRLTSSYSKARQRCIELIDGIIASIPYFLGWEGCPEGALAGTTQSACGNQSKAIGVGAFYVMWPMFVAANSDFATVEQRAFVKARLVHIAENLGINQAYQLIKVRLHT
ncbi:hypothetical protein N431DRAFT_534079 [Stipitochalara longipes BDJ]|nr:hypothetical protein N431DRAFT_534079 [Stipitochalara longipes BDJ]